MGSHLTETDGIEAGKLLLNMIQARPAKPTRPTRPAMPSTVQEDPAKRVWDQRFRDHCSLYTCSCSSRST